MPRKDRTNCQLGDHQWGSEQKDDSWTYFIRYTKRCQRSGCGAVESRDVRRT